MNRVLFALVAGVLLGIGSTLFFSHRTAEPSAKPEKEAEPHGTNRPGVIKLDAEALKSSGIESAPLAAATLPHEAAVVGQVVDCSSMALQWVDLQSARSALQASTKELQRLKTLFAQDQTVSARALEAGELAVRRDEALVLAASTRLMTGWGRPIVERTDFPDFAKSLASMETSLIRIELVDFDAHIDLPAKARLFRFLEERQVVEVEVLCRAISSDPSTQRPAFYAHARTNLWVPGNVLSGWVQLAGDGEAGVLVPRSAVLRHEGSTLVYRAGDGGEFERQIVELEKPWAEGWFVHEGFKPGDRLVVRGAQQLLSEELKSRGGGEE